MEYHWRHVYSALTECCVSRKVRAERVELPREYTGIETAYRPVCNSRKIITKDAAHAREVHELYAQIGELSAQLAWLKKESGRAVESS